ncbi:MAG: hypothetical protein AVDCRST_MAG38-1187 [uncultured Solirubrobacteraceae bacterium]|uniref:Blue (type 1) copper domain-containing protein n=1 Tax=uncultured Solirubrobacteraceae bacterium TaxID=1162706 RepID=A0A6J4RBS1_9ACTN|nr:MAG: hypothetical protein AVDCRST_MAG38-1187 [uncultured Solirubrobacteraceae bacterium]
MQRMSQASRTRRVTALAASVVGVMSFPGVAEGATKKVEAGPFDAAARKAFGAAGGDANAFFRRTVTIRRGDRVAWDINGFHTVTFVPRGDVPPGFVVPDASSPISGSLDAAGAPFWFNGQPRLEVNPLAAFPQGGGDFHADMLHNSGIPNPEGPSGPYRLKFDRPGKFRYLCLVHPGMEGTVRVKRRGAVPSPARDRRQAKREQRALLRRLQRRTTGLGIPNRRNTVVAGNDDRDGTAVFKYFPANLRTEVNASVTLRMPARTTEAHTFTFGPSNGRDAYVDQIAQNLIAPAPGGGAGPPTVVFNALAGYPSEAPASGVPTITPTSHGNGFYNSGILDRDPATPSPGQVRVRFGAAGTYRYLCLLHPFMRGQVTVSD